MNPLFDDPTATLLSGDCIAQMQAMPADSVHSAVTDPPYHLASIVKRFGSATAAPARFGTDGAFSRASRGFGGKTWDGGDIAFRSETWVEVLRVLKPGGHLLAFGSSKGAHRMVCAIEDAGFEIRDTIMWLYGTGMPKSHRQKDRWNGWATALKPAHEPIVMARKPLVGSVAKTLSLFGTGAIHIDACRVERPGEDDGFPANVIHDDSPELRAVFPTGAARFFWSPKANAADRAGSNHPTVKPIALMRYLCRLVTPPGGTVLDPFAGTGTTGAAALAEGFNVTLIEREIEYQQDIRRRLGLPEPEPVGVFA